MGEHRSKILIIEDDKNLREVLAFDLKSRGHQVLTASNLDSATTGPR
ncbi:MAG: hypothetical protein V2A74_10395 [bacterium]